MNILLVDDEPQYLLLVRHYLEDQGWQVKTAENGEDALANLAAGAFDIVITDVYMPIMDGLKFHRTARTNPAYAALPFLFVSAYDDPYTLSAIAVSPNDAFLKKGRAPSEMKEWVLYLTTPEDKRGKAPGMGGFGLANRLHPNPVVRREDRSFRRSDAHAR